MFLLVPAHPGSPGQRAIKWLLLCCCKSAVKNDDAVIYEIMNDGLCILQREDNDVRVRREWDSPIRRPY